MAAKMIQYIVFLMLDYAAMVIYAGRARRYSESVLEEQRKNKKILLPAATLILIWMVVFSGLPVIVILLFLYCTLLIYFLFSHRNDLPVALFASGTFLFHIADLYMLFFGIFSLTCEIQSLECFRSDSLYLVLILLVILASMVCLEIFIRIFDQAAIQILINNKRQLRFAATSLMFIDIYLLTLSIVYDNSMYTNMILLFLIITSLLLFGAFYTSFIHAVKMSLLELYERGYKDLEFKLEQSNRSLGELKNEAYTDALTKVASRRYGLMGLERMMEEEKCLSVCLIDLDSLKEVNDTLGHQEGDRYLVEVAHVLAAFFGSKYVCRLGGDEFLVIMPDESEEGALEQMKKVGSKMEEHFRKLRIPSHPSISYGVVEKGVLPIGSVNDLLEIADSRMYEMKKERHKMRQ